MELNLPAREDASAFDYLFDKFSLDLDEFQKTNILLSSNEAANHEDFTDTFFAFIDSRGNANGPSHSESVINQIQQDFEEFERAELSPCQSDASEVQFNDATKEETWEMINELRHETWEFSTAHDNNTYATQSYSDFCCSVGGMEPFLNHRSATAYGSHDFTYSTFGSGSVARYFFCGQIKNAKGNTPRKKIKRKYRGVILSEEEATRKMEETKIKNRENAAKAHAMKLACEARLHSMHQKLRQKNEHLKKLIMFLQCHERINVTPRPLKRTFSAPV